MKSVPSSHNFAFLIGLHEAWVRIPFNIKVEDIIHFDNLQCV